MTPLWLTALLGIAVIGLSLILFRLIRDTEQLFGRLEELDREYTEELGFLQDYIENGLRRVRRVVAREAEDE